MFFFRLSFILFSVFFLSAASPSVMHAGELPDDRKTELPRISGPDSKQRSIPELILDIDIDEKDNLNWAAHDNHKMIAREAHARKTAAAFGAAGSLAGIAGSFALLRVGQADPEIRRFLGYSAITAGSLSAAALVTGTILWAKSPGKRDKRRISLLGDPSSGIISLNMELY